MKKMEFTQAGGKVQPSTAPHENRAPKWARLGPCIDQLFDYLGAGASLRMAFISAVAEWQLNDEETQYVWAVVQERLGVDKLGPLNTLDARGEV